MTQYNHLNYDSKNILLYVTHMSLKCIEICSGVRKSYGQRSLTGCSSWGHKSQTGLSNQATSHIYIWVPYMKTLLKSCSKVKMLSNFSYPQHFNSIYFIIGDCNKPTEWTDPSLIYYPFCQCTIVMNHILL